MRSKITRKEQSELVRLMGKLEFPVPEEVFYMWHGVFGIVCAELLLIRENSNRKEIFLEYRDDKFFKGWHIQGRVHLPNEKIEDTLGRIVKDELQSTIKTSRFFDWFEYPKGENIGECRRGHAFSFVFIAEPKEMPVESTTRKFFPLNELPENILNEHIPVINKLKNLHKIP